jgi:hypothetical protein
LLEKGLLGGGELPVVTDVAVGNYDLAEIFSPLLAIGLPPFFEVFLVFHITRESSLHLLKLTIQFGILDAVALTLKVQFENTIERKVLPATIKGKCERE